MNADSHCHIFAAGTFEGLRHIPTPEDFIIAADGGYLHCQTVGLRPHLLLGDFDSLAQIPEGMEILRYPSEKDDTDTMLAIKAGLARGYRIFHLHACAGGRLDHTFANLQALAFLATQGAQGFLYTELECFTAITTNKGYTLPAPNGSTFSVFCLGERVEGLCITGAKYPLEHGTLSPSFPLGISNCVQGQAKIRVAKGTLLLSWLYR